ncbi:MAG: hypothetical protein ACLSB9_26105 [Hydrogeniiclostridium mannosilyticum]
MVTIKRLCVLVLGAFLLFGLTSCAPRETTVEKLVGINFDEVDAISFFNGDSGKEYLCSDPEQIRGFLDQFKGVKVRLQDDQSPRAGEGINVQLYYDSKMIGEFNYSEGMLVQDRRYYTITPEFSPDDYRKWCDKINELGWLAPGGIE